MSRKFWTHRSLLKLSEVSNPWVSEKGNGSGPSSEWWQKMVAKQASLELAQGLIGDQE